MLSLSPDIPPLPLPRHVPFAAVEAQELYEEGRRGIGTWAIGSGGRGVVIVLESTWMVIALGCWSSRTRLDGHLMLNCDCQLKFNYA